MIAHTTTATPKVHAPESLTEALELLKDGESEALAGGTWIMRGTVHGVGFSPSFVLLRELSELNRLEFEGDRLIIGANITHDRLAAFLSGDSRFQGLHKAAQKSANPAIRRMATVGGNLCSVDFEAADLPPSLLAASAEVTVASSAGNQTMPLEEFLSSRNELLPTHLVTHVSVPIPVGYTVHERLTMRRAGDYPMVIVGMHLTFANDDSVESARVAIGSVESVPKLWTEFADTLVGSKLDADEAAASATALAKQLDARDGVEAAGWYRQQILPALVKRAAQTLQRKVESK